MNILRLVLLHLSMNYHVLRNTGQPTKGFVTFFSLVALISSKNYQVFQKFLVSTEYLSTFFTLVWFLSQMNSFFDDP